jgi:hypothetical protein
VLKFKRKFQRQRVKGVTEGRVEGMGRRWRRRKQLLDNVKETKRYWKLKEEAL